MFLFFSLSQASQARGPEFLGRFLSRREGRDQTTNLETRDAQLDALANWGIPDLSKLGRLSAITQPVLVANGDNDVMIPTRNSYLLAGHLPNVRLVLYPDAGHGFLFQCPAEFAAQVNEFLND